MSDQLYNFPKSTRSSIDVVDRNHYVNLNISEEVFIVMDLLNVIPTFIHGTITI